MTTAATIFVEAAIGMAAGGGLYAVAGYSTGLVLFGLTVIGWAEQYFNFEVPALWLFRITTSHADSLSTEIQRLDGRHENSDAAFCALRWRAQLLSWNSRRM